MSNHLDLVEIRRVIEAMSSAECWAVQQNSMADASQHWEVNYGHGLLGAVLIYCTHAVAVMGIADTLSQEEASELQALGKLVEDKWRRGQRGDVDPVAPMAEDEQAVDSELTEQLTPGQSLPEFSVALGVKAWEANQAHRLALAEALERAD